jgi:hypothetical protein
LKLGFTVVGNRPLQDNVENRLKTETTLVRAVFATTQSSFEALDTGAVPVVANFGGSGDIVHLEVLYKGTLTTENDIVAQMEKILTELAHTSVVIRRKSYGGSKSLRCPPFLMTPDSSLLTSTP